MIDPKWLRVDPDRVRRSQAARRASVELVDDLIAADETRRQSILTSETLRAEQKSLGKQVAQAKGDEKTALLERTKQLAAEVKATAAATAEAEEKFDEL
ncbi:MAG TPA: serine--tRNA ligase, partial [Tessaracoccus flavescens]|nr:serine--tRNA ligase [Tessaracoccus flavescens]